MNCSDIIIAQLITHLLFRC